MDGNKLFRADVSCTRICALGQIRAQQQQYKPNTIKRGLHPVFIYIFNEFIRVASHRLDKIFGDSAAHVVGLYKTVLVDVDNWTCVIERLALYTIQTHADLLALDDIDDYPKTQQR